MKTKILLLLILIVLAMIGCKKDPVNPPVSVTPYKDYVVFAWNDLGMHCLNPDYTQAVILPPFNTVWAQVIKRGDPPMVVTSDVKVEYRIIGNTYSYGKRNYGQFWDLSDSLFGVHLEKNYGLAGFTLAGSMQADGDHFIARGIPVTPVKDDNTWTPFQVAEVTVKDLQGNTLVQTQCTVPVSDEIHCDGCHLPSAINNQDPFLDILQKHDKLHHPPDGYLVPAAPVLCARCHGSPPLGTVGPGDAGKYASQAIHGAHANRKAPDGSAITCYSCHPGSSTKCNRSLKHTRDNGNCIACHGDLANIAGSIAAGRVPWQTEPKCVTCHSGVAEIDTDSILYRNSKGHGQVYCAACHGSPHAMYASREPSDNYQPLQYQPTASRIKSISSCGACHQDSRGPAGSADKFASAHGGLNPENPSGCNICHTNAKSVTASWPHAFLWMNSNQKK